MNIMSGKPGSFLGNLFALVSGPKSVHKVWTEPELTDWLVNRIAEATDATPNDIELDRPFTDFGLDSRTAVALSSELEQILGRELSPTLIWDYPTIQAVTRYLLSTEGSATEGSATEGNNIVDARPRESGPL